MIDINGIDELDEFIINNNDKIIMLYFGASWCDPCNKLKDKLLDNNEMPNIVICYLDIDLEKNNEICEDYNIKMLPSQIFVKLNKKKSKVKVIGRVDGYDWIKLLMTYKNIE